MRYKQENDKKKRVPGVLRLALVMVLLSLLLPATLDAAQYYVWGRVYSSSPLPEDEAVPPNPLTGVDASKVIGDDMYAVIPCNLARIRVIKASDRSELASDITVMQGGYNVSFTAPTATITVKFIVEELLSGDLLMESEDNVLNQWTIPADENNIRYLLVPGSLTYLGDERTFATCPIGKYTGIFTRVGKIEVATEVEDPPGSGIFTTKHLIDPPTGLVYIYNQDIADDLDIHQYKDSPLGGSLFMFGAFNQLLYYAGVRYRIRIEWWNGSDWEFHKYMDDELVKTRYTVNLTPPPITVTADRIRLGPDTFLARDYCYQLTPLSTGNTFWSFPDLLALWRTSRSGGLNGKYKATIEVVGLPMPLDFIPVPQYTDLTMTLDNVAPVAGILPLYSGAGDTPMIYTPGPPVTSYNLLASKLGADTDYGPTANPICSILDFTDPDHHLAFQLTAYHDNGYMLHWYFNFRRNDTGYTTITGKRYSAGLTPGTGSMVDYAAVPPMKIACTQNDVKGFQNMFLYLNPGHINLGSPDGCAYRFVIHAMTRTTDGYGYLRWRWDEDLHYIRRQ
jgi:hypothetical protein